MIVTAWIIFVVFGLFTLAGWLKFYFSGVTNLHFIMTLMGTFITAISAGYIFGGLTI